MDKFSASDMNFLHTLASRTIEAVVRSNSELSWKLLRPLAGIIPANMEKLCGAFVTLRINKDLRGCIGYILPVKPAYQAVMENAVNASRHDPRFLPIRMHELTALEVEVSILTPPETIASYQDIRLGQDGIILESNKHTAVFLADVPMEQGWDLEETLDHLARKANLPAKGWRQNSQFKVFQSQKISAPIQL